jgi:hypothetical protein
MSDNPSVLFYSNDFLSGTMFFTDDQCGKYIRALCAQHQHGRLKKEDIDFVVKGDDKVMSKFVQDKCGFFYNKRMELEIEKRYNYCNSRKINRLQKKDMSNISKCGVSHRDNDNDNDNDNDKDNVINPEIRSISETLKKRILETRQQKITDKNLMAWDKQVKLMLELDKRSVADILSLINECHDMPPQLPSGFTWRDNILSMGTLRERWNEGKIFLGMNAAKKAKRGIL